MSIYDTLAAAAAVVIPEGSVAKITRKADGVVLWEKPASADPVLNNNDWATISKMSAAGQAANFWNIGDTKAITINGTVGTLSVRGTYYVYILGFAHNGASNTIDFGGFKKASGTDLCLADSKYDSSPTDGTKCFNMQHWGDNNYGGWKGCDLRYDVLGSTNKAPSGYGSNAASGRTGYDATSTCTTSPVSNTLMAALPSDLRAVMKPMTIYTDNTAGGSNTASYVTTSVDYLPLLSEFEVQGTRTWANSAEQNYQKQYAYYSAGNSKIKNKHNSSAYAGWWWVRSPRYSYSSRFCYVFNDGRASSYGSGISGGLAPAFRV